MIESFQMDKFREYLQNIEIPEILIQLLYLTGFDNPIAVKGISEVNINETEKYITDNLNGALANSVYDGKQTFQFLPGHKAIWLRLPTYVEKYENQMKNHNSFVENLPVSFIMKQMIRTALNNEHRDQQHRQFSSEIRHFSTYIYTMCGRACYEVLCHNLPLPQANTVCKFDYHLIF